VLVLLSAFASLLLLWEVGIHVLWLFLFCLPVGFVILTVMVRVAPFLVPPRLYVGKLENHHVITLGISKDL
jgi:hypothetical protein